MKKPPRRARKTPQQKTLQPKPRKRQQQPHLSATDQQWLDTVFDCLTKAEKWARECGEEITSDAPIRNALNDYLFIRARCSLSGNYNTWKHVNEYLHYVASLGTRKEGEPMAASPQEQRWLDDLRMNVLHSTLYARKGQTS